jgi:hypothetical protein
MSNYSLTPNAVDPFTRVMAGVFDEKNVIGVSTGFQAFFGRDNSETLFSPDANSVEIDIIRGNEKTAAFVHRGQDAASLGTSQKNAQAEKYSNFSRLFPLIEEESAINSSQIDFRLAGENPYEARGRQARFRELAMRLNAEHMRRIVRKHEILAAQSILTGKHDAGPGAAEFDFLRNSALISAVTNAWNSGSQDIFGDIKDKCDQLRAIGRTSPDMLLLGQDALDALIKDDDVKERADNRRYELVRVEDGADVPPQYQRFVDAGFIPYGRLSVPGYRLWLFTYIDLYDDENGNPVKYMPVDQALICSSKARADRYFGPRDVIPQTSQDMAYYAELTGINMMTPPMPANVRSGNGIVTPEMFYCHLDRKGAKTITMVTQSAPIYATTQTDGFGVLTGLIV